MEFLTIDSETTGLDPARDRVVEVGYALTSLTETLQSGSVLVNPGIPIPPSASAIHHLLDEDVKDAKVLDEAMKSLPELPLVSAFVAHNAPFDASFLPMLRGPWLDTKRVARRYMPELPEFSNQFLRYALKLDVPRDTVAHRAEGDCIVTASILRYLLNGPAKADFEGQDLHAFIDQQSKPVLLHTVGFGKHKGILWSEVPRGYLDWLSKNPQGDDEDLSYTVRHYLGR
jgi:exodeoxyribonuclease X